MKTNLYRLVYCSRNRLQGTDAQVTAELQGILASARKNNPKLGVTGALLYNAGNFAQVLEGSLESIQQIFEIIQRDPRHSEVTVVESGPAAERDFPEWSMAFSGSTNAGSLPKATAAFEAVFADHSTAGGEMLSVLKDLVVLEDDWMLLEAA